MEWHRDRNQADDYREDPVEIMCHENVLVKFNLVLCFPSAMFSGLESEIGNGQAIEK